MLKYSYKILDRQALTDKVNEIIKCRNLNTNSFILDSEVIYSSVYDFMFKVIDIKIVKHHNKLYTVNSVDNDRWVEPLLIQLNDDGSLMDYFFMEFVNTTKMDLSDYFINYIDFSEIMESVRIINSLDTDKEDTGLILDDTLDDSGYSEGPIKDSNVWN